MSDKQNNFELTETRTSRGKRNSNSMIFKEVKSKKLPSKKEEKNITLNETVEAPEGQRRLSKRKRMAKSEHVWTSLPSTTTIDVQANKILIINCINSF